MNCRPVATTTDWPTSAEVLRRLSQQLERVQELIGQLPPGLTIPDPPPPGNWDLVRGIIHGLHDEARHHGEMYLLFKLRRRWG